jgi:hypothetical protein
MEIKELTEVVDFVIELGNGVGLAVADGKITLGDLGDFLPAARAAMPAISGIGSVDEELLDLSDEEVAEIVNHVVTKFDIPSDKAEKLVEEALELGLKVFKFIKEFFVKEV